MLLEYCVQLTNPAIVGETSTSMPTQLQLFETYVPGFNPTTFQPGLAVSDVLGAVRVCIDSGITLDVHVHDIEFLPVEEATGLCQQSDVWHRESSVTGRVTQHSPNILNQKARVPICNIEHEASAM